MKRDRPGGPRIRNSGSILGRIEAKIDEASKRSTDWRKLENFTDPSFNLGLLLVATAIGMFAGAAPKLSNWAAWISFGAAGLLAWWGVIFLKVPLSLKEFFVNHEDLLRSFFQEFENPKRSAGLKAVKDWTERLGVEGKDARRSLREATFSMRIGLVWAAVFLAATFIFSLSLSFVGFQDWLGTGWAIVILVGVLLGYAALIFWRLRRPKPEATPPST